jgi:hypothetical protein
MDEIPVRAVDFDHVETDKAPVLATSARRALTSVVLPMDVPPATSTFSRSCTAMRSSSACAADMMPESRLDVANDFVCELAATRQPSTECFDESVVALAPFGVTSDRYSSRLWP